MRVLGIDPGYDRLGLAIVEKNSGQDKLIFSTCLVAPKNKTFESRLVKIGTEINELINQWQPDTLAIEKLFLTKNQKTASRVSEVRGMVIYLAASHGLTVYEYTPMEIKLAIAGYGKASKEQVINMVTMITGMKGSKKHDDEYDAIATGLTCLARERSRT